MEIAIFPRWIINKISSNYIRQNDINLLFSNILIVLIFLVFKNNLIVFFNQLPHFCLFDKLVGIECPVCGTTRAFCEIAKGNFLQAYYLNLSSFFIAFFFLFQLPLRIISLGDNRSTKKINRISKYLGNFILIIIVAVWLMKIILNTIFT